MTRCCIRCNAEVADALRTDPANGPVPAERAVVFTSSGNYGSAVFDPDEPGKTLEVVVCDDCLADPTTPVQAWTTRTRIIRESDRRP
ncbi:hypothetical protein DVS28_b0180 (plasmid) [Euzebya pacifica]|uniref:Uncharacterized protein n=1 Tax=Euzebya pacifica TaxID=1608957 RepID=A0A346Y653_9ACTN|nr:hypothetical protein [Euzebya pacifica]AXV09950.1 hypothetical protein DVS28_b0180 [Euzebya pacifica]